MSKKLKSILIDDEIYDKMSEFCELTGAKKKSVVEHAILLYLENRIINLEDKDALDRYRIYHKKKKQNPQ